MNYQHLSELFQQGTPPLLARKIKRVLASDRPVVAVIMSLFNHCEYTRQALNSYYLSLDDRYHYILVLIDDCSSDETQKYIENETKVRNNIVYLRFRDNGGLTRLWNYGIHFAIKQLHADYIILANNDILIPRGEIGLLIDGLKNSAEPAIIGPLTNCPGLHKETQDIRVHLPDYTPSIHDDDIERTAKQIIDKSIQQVHEINGFFWAGTRNTFLLNAFLKWIYFFDPRNRNTENDLEFQRRLRDKNIKILLACNTFIFHYKDVSCDRVGKKIINTDWIYRP